MPALVISVHFEADVRARADQAHVAAQGVPELRQFVEVREPQPVAQPRNARVSADLAVRLLAPARRRVAVNQELQLAQIITLAIAGDHRTKLVNGKGPAVAADALLFE
jgi:hypothetical protein